MPVITTTAAIGKWDNRENLDYRPVNQRMANGRRYNAFGVPVSSAGDPAETRRPYKIEEAGNVTYVMYDDDAEPAGSIIFRIEEA